MFEVGEKYEFKMIAVDGGIRTFYGVVETYDHPLLKLEDVPAGTIVLSAFGGGADTQIDTPKRSGTIINVISPHFIEATKVD